MICELETRYGTMFVPSSDRGQYWWLKNTGASPEDQYIQPICELLSERPKGCVVDVGANFGCWTLALAKVAHTVVAIEPQGCVMSLLQRSVEANGIRNIELIRGAATDHSCLMQIADLDPEQDFNFGGLEMGQAVPDRPMVAVHGDKLDTICNGYMVTFIKMDVEGYETKVLEGARWTIERCKPIIFAEKEHERTDPKYLERIITDMGYAVESWGGNFVGVPV